MPSPQAVPELIEVRKAQPEETKTLVEMILAMAWESEGRRLERDVLTAGVRAVFSDPGLGTYWVLLKERTIIASTLITVEWSDWNNASYWWIQSLYIQPECRGRGMFEFLLARLEEAARLQDVPEIRLYVERNNGRAIRAYEKTGFESEHYLCMTKALQ